MLASFSSWLVFRDPRVKTQLVLRPGVEVKQIQICLFRVNRHLRTAGGHLRCNTGAVERGPLGVFGRRRSRRCH